MRYRAHKANNKLNFNKNIQSEKEENLNLVRLNKYIANSGICSRREADKLIESGAIKVNGKTVTELGTKISTDDRVEYGNQNIRNEKLVYVLLNKPKDYITTMDDPQGRKTVMELVRQACKERIYPVGRLDRNTTGLLLFTNDGDLAKKLTHPKHNIKKIYTVLLDKKMLYSDLMKIKEGRFIQLEDGEWKLQVIEDFIKVQGSDFAVKVDDIAYLEEGANKREVGIELHSGQNRIVRKIFESLGYNVLKLDRICFAGLTKKDLPRGKWRFLTQKEVGFLKMLNIKSQGKTKEKPV